jgi:NAD(P)-dependent dehydrogenase (short-subunit alcohol dehydrogenase family)
MRKIIIAGSEGLIGKAISSHFEGLPETRVVRLDLALGHNFADESVVISIMKEHADAEYLVNLFAINDHVEKGKANSTLFDISLEALTQYCNINLVSLFSVCRQFVKNGKTPKGIVNFSSMYGVRSPKHFLYDNSEKHIGYTITKHGVIGLSQHLATYLAPKTRVNCLVPGGVLFKQDEKFIQKYSQQVPMKRMMNVTELNGIVELLCSDGSTYMNGSVITVDGGWTACNGFSYEDTSRLYCQERRGQDNVHT